VAIAGAERLFRHLEAHAATQAVPGVGRSGHAADDNDGPILSIGKTGARLGRGTVRVPGIGATHDPPGGMAELAEALAA
jgi:hypothetical protein